MRAIMKRNRAKHGAGTYAVNIAGENIQGLRAGLTWAGLKNVGGAMFGLPMGWNINKTPLRN